MTEKVKVTRKVAEAIETLRNADYTDFGIVVKVSKSCRLDDQRMHEQCKVLRDWTHIGQGVYADKLLDALRTGYEIERSFKVGDWVTRTTSSPNSIHEYQKSSTFQVKEVTDSSVVSDILLNHNFDNIRDATPEEIKAEKECRVWKSIGREVGELNPFDVLVDYSGMPIRVLETSDENFDMEDYVGIYPAVSFIKFGGAED